MTGEFKVQVLETFASLITAAFGLVAALAWNETIKSFIAEVLQTDGTVWGNLIYASIVTIIAVVMTLFIARALGKAKKAMHCEEKEEE